LPLQGQGIVYNGSGVVVRCVNKKTMFPNFEKFTLMKTNETTTSDSTGNNTLLAVSGQTPNFQKVVEELLDAVDDATDSYDGYFQKEYASQLFEIVLRDFYQAACATAKGEERKD
jgi:tetrahydromethanopterin S-methyltransferase subunit H